VNIRAVHLSVNRRMYRGEGAMNVQISYPRHPFFAPPLAHDALSNTQINSARCHHTCATHYRNPPAAPRRPPTTPIELHVASSGTDAGPNPPPDDGLSTLLLGVRPPATDVSPPSTAADPQSHRRFFFKFSLILFWMWLNLDEIWDSIWVKLTRFDYVRMKMTKFE
jgi:hypothetical protein